MRFHCALATFDPQDHVVVEQVGAEDVPLMSGRLVRKNFSANYFGSKNSVFPVRIARIDQFF